MSTNRLIEAVMIGQSGNAGISFTSAGRASRTSHVSSVQRGVKRAKQINGWRYPDSSEHPGYIAMTMRNAEKDNRAWRHHL